MDETFESLEIGFELTRDMVQTQFSRSDTIDSKANFVLGSATVIIGTFAAFITGRPSLSQSLIVYFPLFLSYLITIIFAFLGYNVREYKDAPAPRKFLDLLLHQGQTQTRYQVFCALVYVYEYNERQLAFKIRFVSIALIFLCIESIVLMATFGYLVSA